MKKIYLSAIFSVLLASGLLIGLALQAETAKGNSSVSAKKQSNGYYTITIKDPQGLKSFALKSPGNLPYSGDLAECPRVFVIDNVSPSVVNDFSGEVDADIFDCQNNTDELAIPEIGDKKSVVGKREEPPAPPAKPASAAPAAPSEVAPAVTEPTVGAPAEIVYPVSELGGCADKDACKVYCEEPGNMRSCVDFAESHNLITPKEAEEGRKFSSIVNSRGGGPGGCKTREACEAYCENTDNINECLAFAEDSNLVEAKDLEEMRKVAKLLKEGTEFPGGCKSKSQCEAYCAEPDNMEACLVFAEKAGFIPPEELEMARKVVPLMKAGKTPGGCKSKEACEAYCENPDNMDACIAFGEQMGFISPEELTIIKKTGGKGPGGCRGKKQCEDFCQSPENQETCFNFGKDNGLISEDDLKQMEEGMSFIRDALSDESTELAQCLKEQLGPDNVSRVQGGQPIFDRNIEEKLRGCFEQFPPEGMGGPGGPGGFSGPGGCSNQEECQAYCEENPEECEGFEPPGGGGPGGPGGFSGPGGCQSPEECQAYCEENPEECEDFSPPGGGGGFGPPSGGGGGFGPPGGGGQGGGGFPGGPGGCQSATECITYCTDHYTDPGCTSYIGGGSGGTGGGGTGGGGTGVGLVCDYAQPPTGCTLVPGPNYNSQTQCGLVLSCPDKPKAQSCVPPPSGLVSWLNGESLSGASGGVTSAAGKVGNAFKFDGSSGYINMGNPANLNFGTGQFSLEAWFNWTGEGRGQVVNNIIRKSNYGPGAGSGYWLRIGQELEFSAGATTQSEGQSITTAPISAGEWHHAVATKDSSGNMQLYVDGRQQGTIVRQAANTQSTSGSSFAIGAWPDQHSEFFHGLIDEVSVYNRALSSSEVQTIFNAGSAGKCQQSSAIEPKSLLGLLREFILGN